MKASLVPTHPPRRGDLGWHQVRPGGVLRIWKKNGLFQRDLHAANDAAQPGDYVPPGEYTAAQLGFTGRTADLFVEAVNSGTDRIQAELDPDGDGPAGYMILDAVRVTSIYFDLDVNADGALGGNDDGALNYLPGYVGNQEVLSNGVDFSTVQYQGQAMRLVAEGAGTNQHIDAVDFSIVTSTTWDGYAENVSDPAIEAANNQRDFAFQLAADDDASNVTAAAPTNDNPGQVLADSAYTNIYAKDYGGAATAQVQFKKDGEVLATWQLDVPRHGGDLISDRWEREAVNEWNMQYATSHPENSAFFGPGDDKELPDPDASNTDLGTDLPAHKTAGDSLSVHQEFRGFVLDTHGHKRLSPAAKELLVEVDTMENVPHMPARAQVNDIMSTVHQGFTDLDDGAGIDVYWVIDQFNVGPHEEFASNNDVGVWGTNHRNNDLDEFVYLAFTDKRTFDTSTGTSSPLLGSFVFVENAWDFHLAHNLQFFPLISHTIAHEFTHLLLNTKNANGFTDEEHHPDPDNSDGPEGVNDQEYLMFIRTTPQNGEVIVFSNPTRQQLDLTSKESVER